MKIDLFDASLALVLVLLGALLVGGACAERTARDAVVETCGPCDHVADCGLYRCRAGVKGWQKAGGA